jgi:lipopolysaccharide export system permease protein
MDRLRRYLISHFSLIFFSIFIALFSIASIVFMIKLAKMTSVITVNIYELAQLYLFSVPELLFYTMPITFFVAVTLSLHKLSVDNEMIVLFALGVQPNFIYRILFQPALWLAVIMIFNFMVAMPHVKMLAKNFIAYKQVEAQFNLSASEFGHNFGDWLLYIGKDNDDKTYGDVFLFEKSDKEEVLIGAKEARVINEKGALTLELTDGEGYNYSDISLTQINFEQMRINNMISYIDRLHYGIIEYWMDPTRRDKNINTVITDMLIALFPLFSLFAALHIGIVHARHQRSHVYLSLFVALTLFFAPMFALQKSLQFYTIPLIIIGWLAVTYLIYRKKIVAHF